MTEFPEHPFWDWSLRVYAAEGVGPACIALQEARGLDVNLMLFCVWFAASGRGRMTADELAAAAAAVDAWHREVVRPLRAVRTRMKGGMPPAPAALAESLRQRIQKIEIDCEHAEQLMLAAAAGRLPGPGRDAAARAADAEANAGRYVESRGGPLSEDDRARLGAVLRAAFSGLGESAIPSFRAAQ